MEAASALQGAPRARAAGRWWKGTAARAAPPLGPFGPQKVRTDGRGGADGGRAPTVAERLTQPGAPGYTPRGFPWGFGPRTGTAPEGADPGHAVQVVGPGPDDAGRHYGDRREVISQIG
jgi:hypothetical protein